MKKKLNFYNLAFLAPGFIIFTVFLVIPLLLSFHYSFTNWNGLSANVRFVGLKNFRLLLTEPMFLDSLRVTLIITALTTILVNGCGIACAAVLNRDGAFYKLGRTLIFIPAILSPVVCSFIWAYMTQTNGGIINTLLGLIRIAPVDFYRSADSMVNMVSGVISWGALGFYTTIYLANLKSIPTEIYEAADIDGAGRMRQFFSLTIPMLRPAIIINTVTAVIWGLKQYDFVKVMVPGHIQTVTIYAIERAFEYNMFGYSSAVVMVLLILTMAISLIQMGIMNRKEIDY